MNLDLKMVCDVCGKLRKGKPHTRCSRVRQRRGTAKKARVSNWGESTVNHMCRIV